LREGRNGKAEQSEKDVVTACYLPHAEPTRRSPDKFPGKGAPGRAPTVRNPGVVSRMTLWRSPHARNAVLHFVFFRSMLNRPWPRSSRESSELSRPRPYACASFARRRIMPRLRFLCDRTVSSSHSCRSPLIRTHTPTAPCFVTSSVDGFEEQNHAAPLPHSLSSPKSDDVVTTTGVFHSTGWTMELFY
jgi:hypothetical protein